MCSEGHVASVVIAAGFLGVLAWRSTQSREESGPGLQLTHRAKLQHIQQKRAELTHTHTRTRTRTRTRTHTVTQLSTVSFRRMYLLAILGLCPEWIRPGCVYTQGEPLIGVTSEFLKCSC